MPLYEYECESCGERFEELVRSSSARQKPKCPACGSDKTQRVVSQFAVGRSKPQPPSCPTCCPGGTCGLG